MREAPMAYAIIVCSDYRNKSKSAAEILKQWKKDKTRFANG